MKTIAVAGFFFVACQPSPCPAPEQSAKALYREGYKAYREKNATLAEACFRAAVAIDRDDWRSHEGLAEMIKARQQ
jgi:Tfp pilus assembly protein PilF